MTLVATIVEGEGFEPPKDLAPFARYGDKAISLTLPTLHIVIIGYSQLTWLLLTNESYHTILENELSTHLLMFQFTYLCGCILLSSRYP